MQSDYPDAKRPSPSSTILDVFIDKKSHQPIRTPVEFATFNREFRRITATLVAKGWTSEVELQKAYTKSINPDLWKKIVIYIISEKALHIEGEPYLIEQVMSAAEYLLKGCNPCFDNAVTAYDREFSKLVLLALQPGPSVAKSETSELLGAINKLGQSLQVALNAVPNLTHPTFQNVSAGPGSFPRQELQRPRLGANRCFVWHDPSHFMNQCVILAQYIADGQMARDSYNMITLGNGEHIPPDPLNQPWKDRANKYYKNNPHLLPSAQQPSAAQANFAANLVQVGPASPAQIMRLPSMNPVHAATITEITDKDDLPGLDDSSENLEDIGHMVEVLQARAKEIKDD